MRPPNILIVMTNHQRGDTVHSAINPYITVGLAPYGPAQAFSEEDF